MDFIRLIAQVLFLRYALCALDGLTIPIPNIHYNLLESKIWTCSKTSESRIQALEDSLRVHILSRNETTISFLSSDDDHSDASCYCIGDTNIHQYNEVINNRRKRSIQDQDYDDWFKSYHNLSSIYEWFQQLSLEHPSNMEILPEIGRTTNNRAIIAAKLTHKKTTASKQKPIVYLQCLLHAREWITGSMCMYIAYKLANDPTDKQIQNILDNFEIIIVPVANPDGYELTWTNYPKYRLWRKNLSNSPEQSKCLGVDLNRNFDIKWGIHGSSDDHCSETYHGSSPVSEEESKAITELLTQDSPIIAGVLDFHSYSQVILYPSGWTTSPSENIERFKDIAQSMAEAASRQAGTQYTTQQMGSIYLASGTFGDWVNDHVSNKAIPLTVELPPNDNQVNSFIDGFMIKPDKIIPICKEMFDGVLKYLSLLND